ncbi:hypothetical protein Hesp01_30020 [Herbidospora sp. NBRC 101105]|nr:hypothetical protein Hesp01_30020 [Herbidospora sp. NBRC 101105]
MKEELSIDLPSEVPHLTTQAAVQLLAILMDAVHTTKSAQLNAA